MGHLSRTSRLFHPRPIWTRHDLLPSSANQAHSLPKRILNFDPTPPHPTFPVDLVDSEPFPLSTTRSTSCYLTKHGPQLDVLCCIKTPFRNHQHIVQQRPSEKFPSRTPQAHTHTQKKTKSLAEYAASLPGRRRTSSRDIPCLHHLRTLRRVFLLDTARFLTTNTSHGALLARVLPKATVA